MKVKIIHSEIGVADLENKIADWTKDLKPTIININISAHPMYDVYHNQPPTVCNNWSEFTAAITYD